MSNVVLNVNMFLVIRLIKPHFGFELISENVSTIQAIKQIQTITCTYRRVIFTFLKQFV